MARSFDGVDDKITVAQYTAINDLDTFTISVLMYRTASGDVLGRICDKINIDATAAFMVYKAEAGGDMHFQANRWQTNLGQWFWDIPSADTWHHLTIAYDYGSVDNNPDVRIDGVVQSLTELNTPAGTLASETETLCIGCREQDTARTWNGRLAMFGLWSRVLTTGELVALAGGYTPAFFPRGLVGNWDLMGRVSPEPNRVAGNSGTVTGTAHVEHPRVIYPATSPVITVPAVAVTTSPWHVYAQQ